MVRAWHRPEFVPALLARYPDRAVYVLRYEGFAKQFGWRKIRGPAAPTARQ